MRQGDVPLPKPPNGDRPSEIWMCGHGTVGTPCSSGPLPNGRCPAEGLCRPVVGANAEGMPTLRCARPSCLGGPCDPGPDPDGQCGMIPSPCVPVRTSRGRRRLYLRIGVVIGVGIILLAIGGSWRREIFAPGSLAQPHALLLGGNRANDRCAACHPAARKRFVEWFGSGNAGHAGVTQTDLCMNCHHAKLAPETARRAHNFTHEQMKLVVASGRRRAVENPNLLAQPTFTANEIECAVCHREHHGNSADLSAVTNNQCQSCHSIQFKSFAQGHPQWTQWPYDRGGSISFNHSTHQYNHFSKDGTEFDCRSCHTVDSQGEIARAVSFESMCASCHQQPLEIETSEGFTLVGLPTLDGDAVAAGDLQLGAWPEAALGIDRIEIPEMTQALLAANKNARLATKILLDPKLTSLTEPPGQQSLRAMVVVANELRGLLNGLAKSPAEEVNSRLRTPGGQKILGQLSAQLTDESVNIWFKGSAASERVDPAKLLPNGGWYRDELRSAIRYRGTGHADPLLKAIAELSTDPRVQAHQRQLLANIGAVQACLECHPQPNGNQPESWKSVRQDAGKLTLTKYSHGPHLNLPELARCTTCHEVKNPNAVEQLTTVVSLQGSAEAKNLASDFEQLSQATCIGCHTPGAAGDSCTKCHNYHINYWK